MQREKKKVEKRLLERKAKHQRKRQCYAKAGFVFAQRCHILSRVLHCSRCSLLLWLEEPLSLTLSLFLHVCFSPQLRFYVSSRPDRITPRAKRSLVDAFSRKERHEGTTSARNRSTRLSTAISSGYSPQLVQKLKLNYRHTAKRNCKKA